MIKGFFNTTIQRKRFIYDVTITCLSSALVIYCAVTQYAVLFLMLPFVALRVAYIYNVYLLSQTAVKEETGELPSFSILICSYNEKKENLDALFKSIFESTVQPQEILLIDDASTEPIVLDAVYKDRIRLIRNEQNLRLRGSQVKGIRALRPVDYVLFIDSDICFEDNVIYKCLRFIGSHADGLIFGVRISIKDFKDDYLNTFISTSYHTNYYKRLFESRFGVTLTCNGAFMFCDYKFLQNNVASFERETFFGKKLLTGNDKSLTNLALQNGKSYTVPDTIIIHERFELQPYLKKMRRAFKTSIIYQVRAVFLRNVSPLVRIFSALDVLSFFVSVPLQVIFIIALFHLPYFYVYAAIYFLFLVVRNNKSVFKVISYGIFRLGFTILLYLVRLLTLFSINASGWGNR
ncbi:MAG: glycosyltransferase family 2 protein [Bacteroidetes bacterium]|nr:glycosyltransferase family 2 protein [Bacteroidota bacterium]